MRAKSCVIVPRLIKFLKILNRFYACNFVTETCKGKGSVNKVILVTENIILVSKLVTVADSYYYNHY